jgi:hypothetical protein
MQSQRRELFVAGFGKRKDLQTVGIENFFNPIRDEMEKLRTEYLRDDNGEIIRLNGKPIHVTLFCLIADNKGANEVMGITTSFYNSACCRYCTSHWRDLQVQPTLRGPRREEDGNCLLQGVLQASVPFPPDIFHDLNEGVIKRLLEHLFTKHYNAADLKILNERILSLNMRQGRISDLKRVDSKVTIHGTGMQVWEMFLALSFIDRKVPRQSIDWDVYVALRKICIRLHWTSIYRSHLNELQRDIETMLSNYVRALDCNVFPKLHNMLHYSEIINKMGPLMRYSTVRFERMHQTFLRRLAPSRSYVNQSFSLMNFYETTWIPQLFIKQRKASNERNERAEGIHHVKECCFPNGLTITTGNVNVTKGSHRFEDIEFRKITEIVKIEGQYFFFGFKVEIIRCFEDQYAQIRINSNRINIESDFPYHRDIHVYTVKSQTSISHYLLNEFDFS